MGEDIELAITKVEQEKTNRDHTIKTLNDEIGEQDEVINKLNKEKKHIAETQAKSSEDLVVAEEKVGHLNSIKGKLEATLDELEGALDKEKRGRGNLEKERRKVEGELKMTQDLVAELERSKKEIEGSIARKEKDIGGLASKLDDEQSLVAKMQKNIKEAQGRVEEMEEELEAERQARAKAERQRSDLAREIEQLGERLDEAGGATHAQMDLNKKIGEANLTLGDFEASKRKIAAENADLLRVVGDVDNNLNMLLKIKSSLSAQLEEVKSLADNEARERSLLLGKFRNLEHEVDGAKEALDEESSSRDNVLRQASKAEGDAALWRAKYESEAVAKAEELEMTKMKLVARFTEAEGTLQNLNAKLAQVEKSKSKMQGELDDMVANLDQAQVLNAAMERKAKQFDKVIGEWKHKVDSLSFDLDCSQKETRNASSDLFKVKSAYEESMLQLDEVRRENKTLSNEIKDIMDQITEGGRSIHEIDKIRKRLEAE